MSPKTPSPETQAAINTAAKVYLDTILALVQYSHGPEVFDALNEDRRLTCVVSAAIQPLLQPGSHGRQTVSLDAIVSGVGIALGVFTSRLDQDFLGELMIRVGQGIAAGFVRRRQPSTTSWP